MAKHITRQASRDMAFRLANGSSKTARRIRRTPKKSQAQQVSACQPVASTWQTRGGWSSGDLSSARGPEPFGSGVAGGLTELGHVAAQHRIVYDLTMVSPRPGRAIVEGLGQWTCVSRSEA